MERLGQQVLFLDLPDRRRRGAGAVRDRRRDVGRDRVEQRQRDLHDLARHAVGVAQLLDHRLVAVREMRQQLVPAAVRDRAGRLRDVAEDRQRPVARAAGDHPQLHRRQVLRLVDDHVAVHVRRGVEQRARLVEQRDVAVRPAATAAAEQQLLLGRVEDAVGCLGERGLRREQPADEPVGRHERPGRLEHAVEVAARAERLLDLVEVADRAGSEDAAVLLVEAAQEAHPEALAGGGGQAELRRARQPGARAPRARAPR